MAETCLKYQNGSIPEWTSHKTKKTDEDKIFKKLFLLISYHISKQQGFQKKRKKVGLIHPGWLAGVSLGQKTNQKKIVLKKKIQR